MCYDNLKQVTQLSTKGFNTSTAPHNQRSIITKTEHHKIQSIRNNKLNFNQKTLELQLESEDKKPKTHKKKRL